MTPSSHPLALIAALTAIAVLGNAVCVAVYLALRPDAPAWLAWLRRRLSSERR